MLVYYLKVSDSGEYECYLPNGRKSKVKLNVRDPKSPDTGPSEDDYDEEEGQYAIRVYIDKSKLDLKYGQNDVQICTGMTNGKSLEIEWYNPRGQVNI